ncbi:MAG: MBOAT family protein [Desulfuromonadaceae bacterium]|nr:MBOAT family protein [Desulfuromonadaceae bacterium]
MLFNSPLYIFFFLPTVLLVYFFFNQRHLVKLGKYWLLTASLFFYGFWNPFYVPLLAGSIGVNFTCGILLGRSAQQSRVRRTLLGVGIGLNILLLGYFKYANFFLTPITAHSVSPCDLLHLALPLAISFFTLQQIAYLVDRYYQQTCESNFLNYSLFVTFFPQLIAGPIVRHGEMMPQFARLRTVLPNYRNLALGLLIFFIGLFKKVVIADPFGVWATQGFDQMTVLNFGNAWVTSLSYSLQLYFDFSGYTDMAIGAACMFNINLPQNFNSPYKALNIQEFWRRWHITLSRWLYDYLYVPLSCRSESARLRENIPHPNQRTNYRAVQAIFMVFVLYGVWHGAGWTFMIWGMLHGAASIVHRFWQKRKTPLPRWSAWLLTFGFVNAAWVLFRALSLDDALKVYRGMIGASGFGMPDAFPPISLTLVFCVLLIVLFAPNSMELKERLRPNLAWTLFIAAVITVSLAHLSRVTEFLYLRF